MVLFARLEVLLHGQHLADVNTELAKEVVVQSHELHLSDGAEQLPLLHRVERMVDDELPPSAGYGSRRHEDDLNALSAESGYLVDESRHTGDVEFSVLTGQHVRADLHNYSFHFLTDSFSRCAL